MICWNQKTLVNLDYIILELQHQHAGVQNMLQAVYMTPLDENIEDAQPQLYAYQTFGGLQVSPSDRDKLAGLLSFPATNRGTPIENPKSLDLKPIDSRLKLATLWRDNITAWEAGIDYIRLSRAESTPEWTAMVEKYSTQQKELGNDEHDFRASYGWFGTRCGKFQWGSNDAESNQKGWVFVIAEGSLANDVLRDFAFLATNCSRVDLQVTAWLENMDDDIANIAYDFLDDRAKRGLKRSKTGTAPLFNQRKTGENGGDTLYLGSDASKSRLKARLYNKAKRAEKIGSNQQYYANSWRWEIQLADEYAQNFLAWFIVFVADGLNPLDNPQLIAGMVTGYFHDKYVPIPDLRDINPLPLPKLKQKSDLERRWEWLARQVKPSVRDLLPKDEEFTLKSLGLENYWQAAKMIENLSYWDILKVAQDNLGLGTQDFIFLSAPNQFRVIHEATRIMHASFRQVQSIHRV